MEEERGPQKVLMLARQFMESRIILTAAELDLFTSLAEGPASAGELAERLGCDGRGLSILLDALAAMGLLEKDEAAYGLPPGLAPFLISPSPQSVLPMLLHAAHLWDSWSDLTACVKGRPDSDQGRKARERTEGQINAFIGAMHVVARPLAKRIARAVEIGSARRLLDVGGGSGAYTIAFLEEAPQLSATLFDRPEVLPLAERHLAEAGLLGRTTLVAGDFYEDELPAGHDLALLSAIIHQNSPSQNRTLFAKVSRALVPGGRIVIRDHVMDEGRTTPREGAIFAVNMLVNTEGGGTYTFEEIAGWLEEAGFASVRLLQRGERMDGLIEAVRP